MGRRKKKFVFIFFFGNLFVQKEKTEFRIYEMAFRNAETQIIMDISFADMEESELSATLCEIWFKYLRGDADFSKWKTALRKFSFEEYGEQLFAFMISIRSYQMFIAFLEVYPSMGPSLLDLVPHYGCYRDMVDIVVHLLPSNSEHVSDLQSNMMSESSEAFVMATIQYLGDKIASGDVLAATWAPSASDMGKRNLRTLLGKLIAQYMWNKSHPDEMFSKNKYKACKEYRQNLSKLRNNLVEPCLTGKRRMDDTTIPSGAALKKYRRLSKLRRNKNPKGAKVHGTQVNACDIVEKFFNATPGKVYANGRNGKMNTEFAVLNAQFADIHRHFGEGGLAGKSVCIADVSVSMDGTPMYVSIAFAILISLTAHQDFRDKFITFRQHPTWHHLPASKGTVIDFYELVM